MCEELELEGVRRWFYGGTPPPDEAEPVPAGGAASAKAFASVVLCAAGARSPAGSRWSERPMRQLATAPSAHFRVT
jgi:hypothetical protein